MFVQFSFHTLGTIVQFTKSGSNPLHIVAIFPTHYSHSCSIRDTILTLTFADIHFLPVSGMTGAYLTDTTTAPCEWYDGPCLLQVLDDLKPLDRDEDGALRLPVLDRYKARGTVYVMGKIECGTVEKGMKVSIHPGNVCTSRCLAHFSVVHFVDVDCTATVPGVQM